MNLLLDTHMLLWAAAGTLPQQAEFLLSDDRNLLFFSPVSIWEIVIKSKLGRPDFHVDPVMLYNGLLGAQYQELLIKSSHTLAVLGLPMLHKDPFDRLLLAQAKYEGISLVTSDKILQGYPAPVIFIPA